MNWAIEHRRLIAKIAHKVHRRAMSAGVNVDVSDLQQDGCEIALAAQRKFDPARGVKPSTYLYTALIRRLNHRVDDIIYKAYYELSDGVENEAMSAAPTASREHFQDFLRELSKPARLLLTLWLFPHSQLQEGIRRRTRGRRDSLQALIAYLVERGADAQRLEKLRREILTKAGIT